MLRRVLLVEDDHLLRDLLARALESHEFEVVSAASAADARRVVASADPDGAIIDIELGAGPTGFDLAEVLRRDYPCLPIIFLTNVPDPRFAERTSDDLPAGVGYVRKSALSNIDVLVDALDATIRADHRRVPRHDRDPERPLATLTHKQVEVMRLVAEGKSNAQIAEARGVTVKAIEDTVSRACIALEVDPDLESNVRVAAARRFLAAYRGTPTH